jgi:hypothetical protein
MGANGLDDYSPERIGDYAEGYGYIHEDNVQALRKALEGHGYTVLTAEESKQVIIQ